MMRIEEEHGRRVHRVLGGRQRVGDLVVTGRRLLLAERWFPEPDAEGADSPFIETPGPDEVMMVEDLETPAVMGRPLPQAVRDDLEAVARCKPFTDEMRRDWRVESAFGIGRLHPRAGWIHTFAPPGHPNPFADHWLPEATAWHIEKLLAGPRPDGRP